MLCTVRESRRPGARGGGRARHAAELAAAARRRRAGRAGRRLPRRLADPDATPGASTCATLTCVRLARSPARASWSRFPAAHCGLAETANVARSLALESAGQCGPCFNGLPAIATALAELAQPRPAGPALANLQRWAGLVTGRGACHHPDGTVRFVASALTVFAAEIAEHARGRCTATRREPFLPVTAPPPLTESDWR